MEYASGGELYDYLNERKRVSEVEARGIFRQIVSAVHFLHKNRIVHRDLKLENILIDSNGDIKVCKKLFPFNAGHIFGLQQLFA
jgi:NUAK family SNF1-like kinase